MIAQRCPLEPHDSIRIAVLIELRPQIQAIDTITIVSDPNRVVRPAAPGAVTLILVLVLVLLKEQGRTRRRTGIAEAMTHTSLHRGGVRGALVEQEGRIANPLRMTIVITALAPRSATARVCLEAVAAAETMTDSPAQERFTAGHHAGF